MKRFFTLMMAIALMLALVGCGGCEHEWTAADCLNAAACSKCGEIGEPALGHDWAAAACVSPETCTRCGEVRGEPLDHVYGEWTLGETEMIRICESCGSEESAEPDREAYLHQRLKGRWEYYGTNMLGQWTDPYQTPWFTYAEYDGAGNLHYVTGQVHRDMQVVYTGYDAARDIYTGYAVTEKDTRTPLELEMREQGDLLTINAGGEMEVVYCQYQRSGSALLGIWTATENGTLYSVTLNGDGTFTGNLDGEVSGSWLVLPGGDDGGCGEGGCMLYYEQNGQWRNVTGEVYSFAAAPGMQEKSGERNLLLYTQTSADPLNLKPADEATLDILKTSQAEAPEKILGEWSSLAIREWNGSRHIPRSILDYVLTVRDDGTFTLSMDEEIQGTWSFDSVSDSDGFVGYTYRLDYPASRGNESLSFNTRYNRVTFHYRDDTRGYVHPITFARLTEQEMTEFLRGPELLPGDYASEKIVCFDSETQENVETPENGYTITISENGSYTVTLDETVSGEWFFVDLHPEGGHTYLFNHKGSQYESQRMEDGTLAFVCRIDGKYVTIHFRAK